jgi:hypothetical protein
VRYEFHPHQFLAITVGLTLVVIGILEATLSREENEPTHSVTSPIMKVLSGAVLVSVGKVLIHITPAAAVSSVFALLLVQMIYGAWVWFKA